MHWKKIMTAGSSIFLYRNRQAACIFHVSPHLSLPFTTGAGGAVLGLPFIMELT